MRTLISELPEKIETTVTLYLTLDVIRNQKHYQFIVGHDRTGSIQLVVAKAIVTNHIEIGEMLTGSTFMVTGKAISSTQSKTNGIEIQVESITITSKAEAWPITPDSAIDLRFDYRVVDLKSDKSQLMLAIASTLENGCREFLLGQDLTEIHTPKLMGTASESGSQVFKVKYFDTTAYLAQSPQFYKQAAIASGLEGVFEVGTIFRAEDSTSSRHLTEFVGLDVEKAWVTLPELMSFQEQMLTYAFSKLEIYKEKAAKFGIDLCTKPSVQYMTLDEAKEILKKRGISHTKDQDLSDEGERILYELTSVDMIFISDYPIAKRPFYHKWDKVKGTTESYDLIFKGIEITSGSIREHNLATLSEQSLEKGVSLESISHYLDNFKYGCMPHGGFGIGIARIVSKLLGITVKESTFMPRDPERLTP
jgi:aspartyl/asparaginyl-tRNA synthetase